VENDERLRLILGVALAAIVVGGTVDLILDQPEGWLSFHVVFEVLMIAGALLLTTSLWLGWWRSSRSVGELRRSLEAREAERVAFNANRFFDFDTAVDYYSALADSRRFRQSTDDNVRAWRESARQALTGLGEAIDGQFDAWGLTPSEREVALLLLKGHSHKAIAKHTDRSAQTVRQHATSVYRKADLSGRAELSAYFLEDLMLPAESRGEGAGEAEERV